MVSILCPWCKEVHSLEVQTSEACLFLLSYGVVPETFEMAVDRLKQKPFVASVDFDGVIHRYSKGWHDGTIYDPPMPGAKEGLQAFMDMGCRILIYSTRCYDRVVGGDEKNQVAEMKKWLARYNIPYHKIHTDPGKPLAHVFIDDRAFHFQTWQLTRDLLTGRISDWEKKVAK